MTASRMTWRSMSLVVALLLTLAGCASPPTQDEGAAGGGAAGDEEGEGASALEEVYAQVEGLTGKERRDKLMELAAEESGSLSLYTSTNLDESGPIAEDFSDATDIDVEIYRANSESVLQRLLQEDQANYAGADVVQTNGPEMTILDQEGLLLPLNTPVTDDIVEFGVFPTWSSIYLNTFVSAWNTKAVSGGEVPGSWEDVLTDPPGRLAMELGDFDWFATLTKYFVEEKGMTEDEAVELFRKAARQAVVVDGHTVMAELMAAGEFDITTSSYQHRIEQMSGDGAPVAWQPAVEPAIVRPNGIAIHKDTDTPASALLYVEYSLTDAQKRLIEFDRSPASTKVEGGLPEDVETVLVDVEAVIEEQDKWESLYEEIVRLSGGEVIED